MTLPARAGVADSPLPLLGGQPSKHVFTVPGVLQNATLGTLFLCTSLEKTQDLLLAVEVFPGAGGNRENALVHSLVPPGGTQAVSFGGSTYAELALGLPDSALPRSARIVATSTKLACTALVTQKTANEVLPGVAWNLNVIRKTKQQGD